MLKMPSRSGSDRTSAKRIDALIEQIITAAIAARGSVIADVYAGRDEDALFSWRYHRKRIEAAMTAISMEMGEKE